MATEYRLSYTASEIDSKLGQIDNLAKKSEIPSKTSQLTNDSTYITGASAQTLTETQKAQARANIGAEASGTAESFANQAAASAAAAEKAKSDAEEFKTIASNIALEVYDTKTATKDAQKAAEEAQGKAETAQTAAETAKASAETAQSKAESAKSSAQSAYQAANELVGDAQEYARQAGNSASSADSAASSANSSKNAAASSATTATNAANEAKGYRDEVAEMLENAEIDPANAVLVTAQTLTDSQKAQARTNIGAMSADTVIPTVPTNISAFTNDKGYLTAVPSEYVTETELTTKGYLTSYTETDPTVPSWAKASTKPKYTASEVGADASGTASSAVNSHNTSTTAHSDIREQISQLSSEKVDKTAISLGIHADGLIYIYVNGAPVGTGIEQGVSGDVIGYVDANNNIILTGTLAVGTYSVKYELEDGTTVDIGEMEFTEDEPEVPSGGNLADPTSSDWAEGYRISATVESGLKAADGLVTTNFIPAKAGDVLRIKGLDITSYINAYSTVATCDNNKNYLNILYTAATVSVSPEQGAKDMVSVDGDIYTYTILLLGDGTQKADAQTSYIRITGALLDGYTSEDVIITINEEIISDDTTSDSTETTSGNLADPTSADWVTDARLSSSKGTPSTGVSGHIATNFIPAKKGDVLRIKGLDITKYVSNYYTGVWIYKADKTYQNFSYTSVGGTANADGAKDKVTIDGDIITYTILQKNNGVDSATAETAYIRLDGVLMSGYTAEDVIITINEEIV